MKRIGVLALALSFGLGLTSCYFHDFGTGSLSVDFSSVQARLGGDVARVYLLADGLLFSTGGGTPFAAEIPIDPYLGAKIRIDGLPAGPTYKALVGIGLPTTGSITPVYYGESALFKISPGGDTSVEVSLTALGFPFTNIRYSQDLMFKSVRAVGNNFGSPIAAEQTRLVNTYMYNDLVLGYIFSTIGLSEQYDLAALSLTANSLSMGSVGGSPTWLNTKKGIFPFTPGTTWTIQTNFNVNLSGPMDILQSGTIFVGGYYNLFFRRTGGLGGSNIVGTYQNAPTFWSWVNVDVPGLTDMALGGSNAFFAASGKGFGLPPAFLTDPDLAKHRKDFSAPAPILSLAMRPGAVSSIGTLYIGTTDGVWYQSVDEANLTYGATLALTQVPETAGEPIEQMAFSTSMVSSDNQAYLSRYWLFIKSYSNVYKIPFFFIFPGKPTGMAWDSSGNLYLSGSEGLAAVYVGGS